MQNKMEITNEDYKKAKEIIAEYEKQMNDVETKPCWILIDKSSSKSDMSSFTFATTNEDYANRVYNIGNYQYMHKIQLINPKTVEIQEERKQLKMKCHAVIAYNYQSFADWIKDTFPNIDISLMILNESKYFYINNHKYVFINKAENLINHKFHSVIYLNGFENIKDIDKLLTYLPHYTANKQ